jgi:hypothetical protein
MKTKSMIVLMVLVVAVAVIIGSLIWHAHSVSPSVPEPVIPSAADYMNATYTIDGASVTLVNGYAESEAAPGSASKLITQYFGNKATGDLTGNGTADAAFLITQSGGGSGTFYYVVAALHTPSGYEGTNAILLGDRIAPQSTEIKNQEIIVNYADRAVGEPMTAQPSVGVSRYFNVQNGILVEIGSAASTTPSY